VTKGGAAIEFWVNPNTRDMTWKRTTCQNLRQSESQRARQISLS
jgi:hypothetical protein